MTELKYFKKPRFSEEDPQHTSVLQIKTDDIRPNRAQPRANFDQNSIIRLADSIRRYGILQPLTVRVSEPDDSYRYELIAGERRLRAAKMLGYLTVPCIVMAADEQTSAELAIIENLLREDLNMFEEAYGYRKLIEDHHLTQEEVARRMSSSQSAVANKLRLLRLPYDEQQKILELGLSERHARAILRLTNAATRKDAIQYVHTNKLNVQSTEEYVEELLKEEKGIKVQDPDLDAGLKKNSAREREILDTVRSIRHKVDFWIKRGGNAEINVANKENEVEIIIKLIK